MDLKRISRDAERGVKGKAAGNRSSAGSTTGKGTCRW